MLSSNNRIAVVLYVMGILLLGCSREARTQTPDKDKLLIIREMPHVMQLPDFCGEACSEMVLRKLGKKITQSQVFNASGLNPVLGRGCYSGDLRKALQKIGFSVGNVFYYVQAAESEKGMKRQFDAVLGDLKRGWPSIVCMRYD
ncbi:MAG: hypothetical protein GY794_22140, partial [bacterium]|nr:hypothetical protein [bacterium]